MSVNEPYNLPDSVHDPVVEQLVGKNWDEIETLEHAGYLLFPDKLYKRNRQGGLDEEPIVLRVPREHELRKARVQANKIAEDDGLDPDRDKDLVDNIETVCILALAIRNSTPPHEPWKPNPRELEKRYDRGALMQLWGKLDALTHVLNPAAGSITKEEMFALVAALAKERNIVPLHVYEPDVQASFIVTMAVQLMSFLVSKSSSASSEPSTPECSASPTSSS